MKKNGILNSHIAKVLADLGHTDTIVIADCGLAHSRRPGQDRPCIIHRHTILSGGYFPSS